VIRADELYIKNKITKTLKQIIKNSRINTIKRYCNHYALVKAYDLSGKMPPPALTIYSQAFETTKPFKYRNIIQALPMLRNFRRGRNFLKILKK
jgi:hypothetical protein